MILLCEFVLCVGMFAADMLGLPYLPAYFYSAGQNTSSGLNFAVAGSGVTYTSGVQTTPLAGQVDNFELFLRTDPYSKVALANSVTLVSVSGNDYLAFTGRTSAVSLTSTVVETEVLLSKS
jgi:hypothetical protein